MTDATVSPDTPQPPKMQSLLPASIGPSISRLGSLGDIRSWVTVILLSGFFGAYFLNWIRSDDEALNMMNGALIAGFAGAWGYWLGSSAAKPIGVPDAPSSPNPTPSKEPTP